ncbi:hypothetical protein [Heliothis virescens ascovirus 3e]|uniref:Uncharacterized protein n=1 Tax=Heliothis virescens ascovirus 3e TaxID=260797 RepID=A4KXE0_HVAVE|nr:hypothetical protein HVAV3e_gp084 [Heliothis virescens ascovirus 3e]ABO37271.1 hypothetical protein [Heliothis virescens ascovirus 3e]
MTLIIQSYSHAIVGDAFIQDRATITEVGNRTRRVCAAFQIKPRDAWTSNTEEASLRVLAIVRGVHCDNVIDTPKVAVLRDMFDGMHDTFESTQIVYEECPKCGCELTIHNDDCRGGHGSVGEFHTSAVVRRDAAYATDARKLQKYLNKKLGYMAAGYESTYESVVRTLTMDNKLNMTATQLSLDDSAAVVVLTFEYTVADGSEVCAPFVWDATAPDVLRCHTVACLRDVRYDGEALTRIFDAAVSLETDDGISCINELSVTEAGGEGTHYMRRTVSAVGSNEELANTDDSSRNINCRGVLCDGRIVKFRVSGAMVSVAPIPITLCPT